jgi:hypothetical protein
MLNTNDFMLFNENDFNNIIGEQLSVVLEDRGINGYPEYFMTYVSLQIANHIREYTSLNIYKEYSEENPDDYNAYLGLANHKETYSGKIINATVIPNTVEYSKDWLYLDKEVEKEEDRVPVAGEIYNVKSIKNSYFVWYPSSEKYVRVNPPYITFCTELTPSQVEMIKLACVYQADYIIDNGSTERMTAMGMVNRSNKYNKADLHEFEICSMSHMLLANAGLLYAGIGGGVYAKIK